VSAGSLAGGRKVTAAGAAPAGRLRLQAAAPGLARLLRLELRRNPMLWMVPLLAVLFWFSTYRPSMNNPPLWNVRSAMIQTHAVLGFAPLLAGVAAWVASRDGRRRLTGLVSVTALPRWAGRLTLWAATTCWAELVYLAGVAVLYAVTEHQGAWGGPLWWPVAVGAAVVAASCALGFAAGTLLPGRLTAALAAVVVFLALVGGAFAIQGNATYALIWPLNVQGAFPSDSYGIFYPYLPDLPIDQVMFLAGLALAALGALGLPASAGGRRLRGIAAAVTAAGLAATGTAVGLAGTARLEAHGIVIPALHDAASDRPVPYTPVCGHSALPICLQPAYRAFLPAVTAAIGPVLDQVGGVPGAPVRVTQVAVTSVQPEQSNGVSFGGPVVSGSPPVLYLPLSGLTLPGEGRTPAAEFIGQLRENDALPILNDVFGLSGQQGLQGGAGSHGTDVSVPQLSQAKAAQTAVALALAKDAGLFSGPFVIGRSPAGSANRQGATTLPAAVQRFAALSPGARHSWLAAHLHALRAGRITLAQLP
jgi:hypothetical protein